MMYVTEENNFSAALVRNWSDKIDEWAQTTTETTHTHTHTHKTTKQMHPLTLTKTKPATTAVRLNVHSTVLSKCKKKS